MNRKQKLREKWHAMRAALVESPNQLASIAFVKTPNDLRALDDESLKLLGMAAMFGILAADTPIFESDKI